MPVVLSSVRVETVTSATAQRELKASPRKPKLLSSCGPTSASREQLWVFGIMIRCSNKNTYLKVCEGGQL